MNIELNETAYESINDIELKFRQLPNTGRSIKAIAKAVMLAEINIKIVSTYVEFLEKRKELLPTAKGADIQELSKQLESYELGIGLVNRVLESVNNIFNEDVFVELDEPNTLIFLAEVKKARKLLNHLIGYVSYYIEVANRSGEMKKVTYLELMELVKQNVA